MRRPCVASSHELWAVWLDFAYEICLWKRTLECSWWGGSGAHVRWCNYWPDSVSFSAADPEPPGEVVPFEMKTAEQKFLAEAQQFLDLPALDRCQHQVGRACIQPQSYVKQLLFLPSTACHNLSVYLHALLNEAVVHCISWLISRHRSSQALTQLPVTCSTGSCTASNGKLGEDLGTRVEAGELRIWWYICCGVACPQVIVKLRKSCGEATEEELGKLSVELLNCQSQTEQRQTFPCTQDMVSVASDLCVL